MGEEEKLETIISMPITQEEECQEEKQRYNDDFGGIESLTFSQQFESYEEGDAKIKEMILESK